MLKKKGIILIFGIVILISLVFAGNQYSDCEIYGTCETARDIISAINYTTVNVNNSIYWDGNAFSHLADTYVPYIGANANVDLGIYNFTTTGNFFGTFSGNSSIWSRAGTNTFLTNVGDRVGIGTNSPGAKVEIKGDSADIIIRQADNYYSVGLKSDVNGMGFLNLYPNTATDPSSESTIHFTAVASADNWINNGGDVGIGTTSPSYPLEINGDVSGISLYTSANISATGYNTRTSVFDKSKNVWDYIKDASYYLIDEKIDHSKFYGYVGTLLITDYSRPVETEYVEEVCKENEKTFEIICINQTKIRTTYPYTKTEGQISLGAEIDILRQAVYELKVENDLMKQSLCKLGETQWC